MEEGRLAFITERDGPEEALDFARRTLKIYRNAIRKNRPPAKRSFASCPAWRRTFILSCLEFRRYVRERPELTGLLIDNTGDKGSGGYNAQVD